MKPLRLDLHRANRPDAAAGLIVLVLAVVALLAAVQYLDALEGQGEAMDERESAIARAEQRHQVISKAHEKRDNPRAAELMAQQRFATEPARDLIEGGWNPNIALLTLEVATASRQINIVFETRTVQEALSYADWFDRQPGTEQVTVKRQVEKPGPPVKSVETTLQVTWRAMQGAATAASAPQAPSPGAPSGARP